MLTNSRSVPTNRARPRCRSTSVGRGLSEPLKILVVDDEDLARRKILRFLAAQPETYTIAEATNGLEALDQIAAFASQIVFLDVQMPGLTGFDVLYHLE